MPVTPIPQPGTESNTSQGQVPRLACQLCDDGIRSNAAAGSGYPTSNLSTVDLTAALLARHLRYDRPHPTSTNEHMISSKLHASSSLCTMFQARGVRLPPLRRRPLRSALSCGPRPPATYHLELP